MTPVTPSFAAFRGPADRSAFEPRFGLWQRVRQMPHRFWIAVASLPDRGRDARQDDLPAQFFRFPPF